MCSELSEAKKDLDAAQRRMQKESHSELTRMQNENNDLLETIKTIMTEVRLPCAYVQLETRCMWIISSVQIMVSRATH